MSFVFGTIIFNPSALSLPPSILPLPFVYSAIIELELAKAVLTVAEQYSRLTVTLLPSAPELVAYHATAATQPPRRRLP